ncbi:hypothetical protein D3C85_1048120 [compost metagenome]
MATAKKMTASNLRIILSVIIFLITGVSIGGFLLLTGSLKDYASEVSKTNGEAQASETNIQSLQKTQTELEKYKETAKRAQNIVSESASYQYQDQITRDLNSYAAQAGIAITGFTFDAVATATTPATPGTTGTGTTPPAPSAPAGLNSRTVTIQLESSVSYKSLLTFMNMIEENLTKMQIAKVTLAKSSDNNQNVAGQTLAIEVYVK